jgi:threonine/homoserine/homoserine lactone efflux protein
MFPTEILIPYLAAVLLVVVSPGPDNILAISRGLSQGPIAATLTSVGAGLGIMFHTIVAALGLSIVLQASPIAFLILKGVGAAYLLWLGFKALWSRSLISFELSAHQSLKKVFLTGLLSNILNPKPGLFVIAFIPQFTNPLRGPMHVQLLVYSAIFALLTAVVFSLLGAFAAKFSSWLAARPKVIAATNIGAGLAFIGAGLSILALSRRP